MPHWLGLMCTVARGRCPGRPRDWGAVLTRGGYLVQTWGDPTFKQPSASLGKCITRALFGITVEAGLIDPDAPIHQVVDGARRVVPSTQVFGHG